MSRRNPRIPPQPVARWLRLVSILAGIAVVPFAAFGAYRLWRGLHLDEASASLKGLPLVEVAAANAPVGADSATMVILLTGDGGWSTINREIAAHFAAQGIPVVAWNSLRYYWPARTPKGAAADLERIMAHYSERWDRPRVLLIGYSFGADVLPFLITRLPERMRRQIAGLTLLGFAPNAGFEFHLPAWLGIEIGRDVPTAPEVARVRALGVPVLCINGQEEDAQGCPELPAGVATVVMVPGGHHFDDRARQIGKLVLRRLKRWRQNRPRPSPINSAPGAAPEQPRLMSGTTVDHSGASPDS